MRHLRQLLSIGLNGCANPDARRVTRHYLPVSREEWVARRQTPEGTPSEAVVAPSEVASQPEAVHAMAAKDASRRVAPDPVPARRRAVPGAARTPPRSEQPATGDAPPVTRYHRHLYQMLTQGVRAGAQRLTGAERALWLGRVSPGVRGRLRLPSRRPCSPCHHGARPAGDTPARLQPAGRRLIRAPLRRHHPCGSAGAG